MRKILERSETKARAERTFRSAPFLNDLFNTAAPPPTKLERRMSELERAAIMARIKQARTQAGLTQDELADLLNVQQRTIANYESIRVPWRYLDKIAEVTGVSQEWLIHGERPAANGDLTEELRLFRETMSRMVEALARIEDRLGG